MPAVLAAAELVPMSPPHPPRPQYCFLPIRTVIQAPRRVDPRGKTWNRLRASIGQPNFY